MGGIIKSPHAGRIDEDDGEKSIEEWLRSTDQLIYGVPAPSRKEKRFDVWLNEHHQETIKRARELYGATAATVIRTALDLLRMKLDQDARAGLEGADEADRL
jgi:hypothetical protein